MPEIESFCEICGNKMVAKRKTKRFCSPNCESANWRKGHPEKVREQREAAKKPRPSQTGCVFCGKTFQPTDRRNVCCSPSCSTKRWREANKQRTCDYNKKYQEEHKEQTTARNRKNTIKYRIENAEGRKAVKIKIFDMYGGCFCACCGEDNLEFLSIDHINNDGAKHRRELKKSGTNLYHWIVKNNYPPGFRVLCLNCNHALGHYGYCPHKTGGFYGRCKQQEVKDRTEYETWDSAKIKVVTDHT